MKKINFITNQSVDITSGGWSGISYNIYKNLENTLDVNYIGPINPPSHTFQELISKIRRKSGIKSDFSFFSEKRLKEIERTLIKKIKPSDYNLFFGQTPWINCNFDTPYGVYMDADFLTYLEIYSNPKQFKNKDLRRIARKEEKWLQSAQNIFVGSQWAWDQMVKHYDLNERSKKVVHTGGNIEMPHEDRYSGSLDFVFISLYFEKKGGIICFNTFKKIKEKYPSATLTIIGEQPPINVLETEGVTYAGLLRKTVPDELVRFKEILSKAFLLIHPTTMDTMGAVLIEAGYFGCPSVAPKSFGVPELVLNHKTGIIVDVPFTVEDFTSKIESLISDRASYLEMRKNSWEYTRSFLTWKSVVNRIEERIIQ